MTAVAGVSRCLLEPNRGRGQLFIGRKGDLSGSVEFELEEKS